MWWLWIPLLIIGVVLVVFLLSSSCGRYPERRAAAAHDREALADRVHAAVLHARQHRGDRAPESGARERAEEDQPRRCEPEPAGRPEGDEPPHARGAPRLHGGGTGAGRRSRTRANRQMRRQAERMQQQARGGRSARAAARASASASSLCRRRRKAAARARRRPSAAAPWPVVVPPPCADDAKTIRGRLAPASAPARPRPGRRARSARSPASSRRARAVTRIAVSAPGNAARTCVGSLSRRAEQPPLRQTRHGALRLRHVSQP